MASNLLVITQAVDINDPILGFFHRWLQKMAARVDNLLVICLVEGEHHLPKNVQVLSLGKEGGASRIKYLWRFYKYIFGYKNKYNGIFIHMNPEYAVLGGLFWRWWGKKTALWYVHKAVNLKLRWAEKFVDKIFTASKESFRLPSQKIEIVGHGIDTELFKPAEQFPTSGLQILTVGRVSIVKDLKTIILAVAEINKVGKSNVSLTIAGDPVREEDKNYYGELLKLRDESGLDRVIHFVGQARHHLVPQVYQKNNVFVHASKTGSLDKVVLEALACGLTVFTSSEAFVNFPDNVIYKFKQGDYKDLANKIEDAMKSGKISYNEAGVKYIRDNFDLDKLIDKIVKFFN